VDDLIIPSKACTKCQRELPLTEFSRDPRYKGGFKTWCKACAREYQRSWTEKNIDKERARWERERKDHPERGRERTRLSYEKHAEKRRAERREYGRTHREEEVERARAYAKAHPYKHKEHDAAGRARRFGVAISPVDYEAIFVRDAGVCHICGKEVEHAKATFDHIVPMSKGGSHAPENIAVAHYVCNRAKNAKVP
jgi:5-methylcytosine-specific restriction endonuclease McrA